MINNMKISQKEIIGIGVVVISLILLFVLPEKAASPSQEPTTFEECAAQGNPIMESYPRQCRTEDGKTFVENIGNELDKIDLIRINSPRPNAVIGSPLTISGEARGYWFFEGDFPVILKASDGEIIAQHFVTSQGEWMTENFVPFEGDLSFETPEFGDTGTLILQKDNASGLPEHDDALEIPIKFK